MKTLTTILLLILSINVFSQDTIIISDTITTSKIFDNLIEYASIDQVSSKLLIFGLAVVAEGIIITATPVIIGGVIIAIVAEIYHIRAIRKLYNTTK